MKVTWADTFRDGGSYEVEFQNTDGSRLVIFLKIHRNSKTQSFDGYGKLYDRSQYDFDGSEQPVLKGSSREKEILALLEEWTKENVPTDVRTRIAKKDWKYIPKEVLLPVRLLYDIPTRAE